MDNNCESAIKIKVRINSNFYILSNSNSLFTDALIASPSKQSKGAEIPSGMIKRKNNTEIMTNYNSEPTAKRHKLEEQTSNPELKKNMQSAIRSKRYRDRLKMKKESLEVVSLLNDKDDAQSDEQGYIYVDDYDSEIKKKKQSAIRSKKYRDRLKKKKESLELEQFTFSDIQGDIPVEVHNPELKKKIHLKDAALLSNKDDSQSDIPVEALNPELRKRMQGAIRAKQYRDRLKLRKKSLEVDPLLINKDNFQSDVQGDVSMEALNPELKKRMQAAIRSKRYRERLKLRKSLEVDPLLINKGDSQSDVLENTSTEAINRELNKKKQGAIRSKRYRDRLKLAKERSNVDDFSSIKHNSESDDVSEDSLKDGKCLFSSLIRKLQQKMSSSEIPKQLLQSPDLHSCRDPNNFARILRGELDSEALDCVTVFSKLLDLNNGVWPIKYS